MEQHTVSAGIIIVHLMSVGRQKRSQAVMIVDASDIVCQSSCYVAAAANKMFS